jgi:quinol monooxygenase YgiN
MPKPAAIAKLTATPGKREDLITALSELVAVAEGEPGTEIYCLLRDAGDEDAVWFFELYRDQSSLDAHSSSDGMKAVFPKLAGLVGGAPELHFVEPVKAKGVDIG